MRRCDLIIARKRLLNDLAASKATLSHEAAVFATPPVQILKLYIYLHVCDNCATNCRAGFTSTRVGRCVLSFDVMATCCLSFAALTALTTFHVSSGALDPKRGSVLRVCFF